MDKKEQNVPNSPKPTGTMEDGRPERVRLPRKIPSRRMTYRSGRPWALFFIGVSTALVGSEIAHRYWKPDLVDFNFLIS
jgi:hypothetical protein